VRRVYAVIVSLGLLSLLLVSPSALAQPTESIETLTTKLPWTLEAGTAVSTGTSIYLLGGFRGGSYSDRITRFNPANATFSDETARLPFPLVGVSAVWTGTEILAFGGQTESVNNAIATVRFDPSTGTIRNGTDMPTSRAYSPVVWTGRYAYIFGGSVGVSNIRYDVLRYDPQGESMDVVTTARMPLYTRDATATWDGARATLFGGGFVAPGGGFTVMTFDPSTETLSYVNGTGFHGQASATSTQVGSYAYVFGGLEPNVGIVSRIQRFRTGSSEQVAQLPLNLTRPLALTTSAAIGDKVYIFGGWPGGFSDTDQIQVLRSVDTASPLLWVGVAGLVLAAVATAGVAMILRRRKRRMAPPEPKAPE